LDNIILLIEACKKQEPRSQKMLYERFFGYLLKISFRYVHSYDTAVDVTNDGFVKIFQNINKFRTEEGDYPERLLMAWMKRIIINTSIDELRRNNKIPELGVIPEHVWEIPDDSQRADNLVLYKELVGAVRNLPRTYRIVFNMAVIDGCTHFEIAHKLGISVGTSKSNLSRARGILQKFLKGNEKGKSVKFSEENIPELPTVLIADLPSFL